LSNSIWQKIDRGIKESEKSKIYPLEEEELTMLEYEAKLLDELKRKYSTNQFSSIKKLLDKLDEHVEFLDNTFEGLLERSGGRNEYGQIIDSRNNAYTNELIIENGKGARIREMMEDNVKLCNEELVKAGYELEEIDLALKLYYDHESKGKSWEVFNFNSMPVGALEPMFSKLKNDVKSTKVYVLKKLNEKQTPDNTRG